MTPSVATAPRIVLHSGTCALKPNDLCCYHHESVQFLYLLHYSIYTLNCGCQPQTIGSGELLSLWSCGQRLDERIRKFYHSQWDPIVWLESTRSISSNNPILPCPALTYLAPSVETAGDLGV